MIIGSSVPRLTHILKIVPKNTTLDEWMQSADVYLSTWLNCVGAKQLDTAIPASERAHLAASLDLPSQFGGVGLQSLIRGADKKLFQSWAWISADLIPFCISNGVYMCAPRSRTH